MQRTWKDKLVVVTGGTGFIGSHLVESLLEQGARVRVPVRAENYRALSELRSKIEWIDGDLRDPEYCLRLVAGANHLFHLASHRRNVEFHRSHSSDVLTGNVEMSLALVRALKEYSCGVTFMSSANVPPEIDVIKLAQASSIDGYILGKALAEAIWLTASHQHGFPLLILRPVGSFGERDTFSIDGNVIPSLMVKAETEKELVVWGSGAQERAFLYIRDLVDAVFTLLHHEVTGIQYITPPTLTTVGDLATNIRDLVHPTLPIRFDLEKPEGSRTFPRLPVHESLKDFAWTPLKEGLERTYDGWKEKGKPAKERRKPTVVRGTV